MVVTRKNPAIETQFENYFKRTALIYALLGILHFILPTLDKYWGVVLIVLAFFSYFVRKKSTVLIGGVALILVGVSNAVTLIAGYSGISGASWTTFGLIQIYLGIAEIVQYFKIRRLPYHSGTKKIISILSYIVLVLTLVFYIYMSWFYVPESTLIKTVNGINTEIKASQCLDPYYPIFDRCCIPHPDHSWLCDDEGVEYDQKLNMAFIVAPTIKNIVNDTKYAMSFESPEGYYSLKDTYEGGIPVPYIFVKNVSESTNLSSSLYITFLDFKSYNFTSENWKQVTQSFVEDSSDFQISESKNAQGYKFYVTERAYPSRNGISLVYEKNVVFADHSIWLRFESVGSGKNYVKEFDSLVHSVRFFKMVNY